MLKRMLANFVLLGTTFLLLGLFMEFVVFRYMFIAPDVPGLAWENEVVRHTPGQSGLFLRGDDISAVFRINAQGWNSGHPEYSRERTPGVKRIVIVGDSYVEGLQVDYDRSVAEELGRMLGKRVEVYRFGMSGAPLSQYLHMLRNEVLAYSPDLVVVLMVHNDFEESYRFMPGAYTSSFLKLRLDDGEVAGEIAPAPFDPPWYEFIRSSATWRYLSIRKQFSFSGLRDLVLGPTKRPGEFEANIRIKAEHADSGLPAETVAAARYCLGEMTRLSREHGFQLLAVMDGVRGLVERQKASMLDYSRGALRLNRLVREEAARLDIPSLDLHPVFAGAFAVDRKPFSFATDAHWNGYAHTVAAEAMAETIRTLSLVD